MLLSPPGCRWHCRLREDTAETAQASTAGGAASASGTAVLKTEMRALRKGGNAGQLTNNLLF
jgi:hypothetical protein